MEKHTEEAIPLAVASQVAEVSSTAAVETKGKKKSPKKAPTQRTTEDKQEKKTSETQVAAKKSKEPVKDNVPAIEANGISQPKATGADVKKERGRAKVVFIEDVEDKSPFAEGAETKEKAGHFKKKNFECNVCPKTFSQLGHLNRHVRTHTDERAFQCKTCKKRFTEMGSLKRHVVVHTGERRYVCTVCSKSFNLSSTLKLHLRVHTGEKPFQCKICMMLFADLSNMRRHERLHTGEKPHRCSVCKRQFARKSDLVNHLRTHQEKPDDSNVVGTENADVMPGREISNYTPTPTTKGLGKRRLNRKRIVSDDEDFEVEKPPVVKFRESSSEEDDEPIRYFVLVFHSINSFILNLCVRQRRPDGPSKSGARILPRISESKSSKSRNSVATSNSKVNY